MKIRQSKAKSFEKEIRLHGIYHDFNNKKVLENVSLQFQEGDIYCIMGPSGSGKTTLFQILLGAIKPKQGLIEGIEGRRISAVFQEDRLIEHWDAVKNIQFVLSKETSKEKILAHLKEVGIEDGEGKMVGSFSGGMKRRVEIVRAMIAESELIMMDEPLKGLDDTTKQTVIKYIHKYRQNRTLLVITHDREEVFNFRGNEVRLESI